MINVTELDIAIWKIKTKIENYVNKSIKNVFVLSFLIHYGQIEQTAKVQTMVA